MKINITLKEIVLAMWTVNAVLVLIGATAVILDQLNLI
tara:strand:+ start:121 stop:234 length:114 start_codon:yes stop_codon:yes gene_type:complete